MKKLLATFVLLAAGSVSAAAQEGLNPTSAELDQALEHVRKMGFDTSGLPSKEVLKRMLSGESGRRLLEMATKMQAQHPDQLQRLEQELQQPIGRGDGMLGPHERGLLKQAIQQRGGSLEVSQEKDRPSAHSRALNDFDRNDDGHLGPLEFDAARRARQQDQQDDNQPGVQRRRGPYGLPARRAAATDRAGVVRSGAVDPAVDRGPSLMDRGPRPSQAGTQPTSNNPRRPVSRRASNHNRSPINQ